MLSLGLYVAFDTFITINISFVYSIQIRRKVLVKVGLICTIVLMWITIFDSHQADESTELWNRELSGLNVWLDLKQTKEFTGNI